MNNAKLIETFADAMVEKSGIIKFFAKGERFEILRSRMKSNDLIKSEVQRFIDEFQVEGNKDVMQRKFWLHKEMRETEFICMRLRRLETLAMMT